MKWATAGTLLAAELALIYGWAINLGGGYHHAKRSGGEGFCIYNDIILAIKELREKNPSLKKFLIIDLDAHRGNGHESYRGTDNDIREHVEIFDIYNKENYPGNGDNTEQYITYPCPVKRRISEKKYLDEKLKPTLKQIIEQSKPDFILYVAGSDIYEHDPIGGYNVTKEGIIERDRFVFEQALSNNIPIVMMLAGGYHDDSAQIVGESIENILSEFDLLEKPKESIEAKKALDQTKDVDSTNLLDQASAQTQEVL